MAGRLRAVLVTQPDAAAEEVLAVAARDLQGGIDGLVVRRPQATAREVFDLTRRLRPATRRFKCALIVSDRADVAVAADADGVHLGERSLPLAAARRVVRGSMLVGRSVHNLYQVGQVEEEGADYIFLGPLFVTRSHPGQQGIGIEHYQEAVLRAHAPVLAIGGVTGENVRLVAQAGGSGAAAISAFSRVADPAESARAFRAAFA